MKEVYLLPITVTQAKVLFTALYFFTKENEIILRDANAMGLNEVNTSGYLDVIALDENAKELQDELTARFGLTITE